MSKILFPTMLVLAMALIPAVQAAGRLDVLLLTERFPGTDTAFVETLRASLEAQGFAVKPLDAASIQAELAPSPGRRLLVLPNSACFPVDARQALVEYVKSGGNLLTIGGPPLSKQVIRLGNEWLTQDMLLDRLAGMPPGETLLDFGRLDLSTAHRDTGMPDAKVEIETAPSGVEGGGSALEFQADSVKLWEFQDIPIHKRFPAGDTVTTFWAKGNENARKLIVAWIDSNDARWNTYIDLTTSWKRYALPADVFDHWRGPGGPEDRLDTSKCVKFKVGFENHILRSPDQPAQFWITDVRSMPNPAGDPRFDQPLIETMSPWYKTYSTTAAAYIPTHGSYEGLGAESALEGSIKTVCSLPRSRGLGFNKTAPRRWIPVLAAKLPDGHIGGAAAALYVQDDEDYHGSVWATLGIEDPDFVRTHGEEIARQAVSLVKRIDEGLYLLSGGVDRASYFEGTPVAGAVVLNPGGITGQVEISCSISADPKYAAEHSSVARHTGEPEIKVSSRMEFQAAKSFRLEGMRTVCELGPVKGLRPGFYVATVSIRREGELLDEIRQPFSIIESKPVPKSELVTIKGDQFQYKGKPWYSLGINYRPVYVASMEEKPFWQHWCHPDQYDAEIIEMELDLMNKIGLNTVALIVANNEQILPAFVDFMERAHRHGLKCHVFMPGLHPLDPRPKMSLPLIKGLRLWERPSMFAYDVAWEVRVGREEQRQSADKQWKRWIEDRYGSVEDAEKDWGFTLRKDPDGRVHGPTDAQITEDGPWNKMVAAYRRFWDDRISRGYMEIARIVDGVDPYHPISARSGFNGTGSLFAVPQFPYDLLSGAKHLDYISPEAYNVMGDWQSFREAGFTTLYGKFVSGGKPIYWAELGYSAKPHPTAETLEEQRLFYDKIYRMFHETRSAGSAAWWWPGYLIWEESDYSVINPDFTPRPAAHEFTKMAKTAAEPHPLKKPDYWIEIDRDLHANGYAGMLANKRAEYGKAVAEGKTVGLRTKGTGTDTSNFPRLAIGNTPLNGKNPPKYLNAEFNSLEVLDASGKWVSVEDGGEVVVRAGSPVQVRASLGNIAETKWLAPKGDRPGGVFLKAEVADSTVLAPIASDAPFLSDADVPAFELSSGLQSGTRASFQLTVGDTFFGEKRDITVVPESRGAN
jgi:hypothetical protein